MRKGTLDGTGPSGAGPVSVPAPSPGRGTLDLTARARQDHAALIGRLGHDVRGVLGAADGFAQLLELRIAGPLSAEQERDIARIRALLRTATDLVDDIVHAA